MFAVPVATLVANPCTLALLMVATAELSEPHCTVGVRSCVLPSVKVPVAANCCVVPRGIAGMAGVIASETRAACVTPSVVVPEIPPELAVTVVLPTATPIATPWAFTLATVRLPVLQVTAPVKSSVLPSV